MSEYQCENCSKPITPSEKICPRCGYPQQGSKAEKISYNSKLMRIKDLVEDSDKSVKGILSIAIIFIFMAFVVLAFSLIFNENHFQIAFLLTGVGLIYLLLNKVGRKSAYLMIILALLFYVGHTIYELSHGIYPKSPVNMDDSFVESKGASLIYIMIPAAYILFRLALMIVLLKYLLTQFKLKKDERIVDFVRSKT